MKKIISSLLVFVLMASFTACTSNSENQIRTTTTKVTTTTTTTTKTNITTTTEKKEPESKYPTETELIDYIKKEYNKLSKDTFTVIFKEYKSKSPVYTLKMIMNGAEMELGEIILGSSIDSSSSDYGRIISVNSTSTLPIGDLNSYAAYNYQIAAIPVYAMAKLMGDTYLDFDGFYKQFSCCAETTGSYVYEISNYDIMGVLSKTNLSSSVVYGKTECELLESVVSAYQVN